MPIIKVQHVPLIAQPTDGVCWFVCAQMVYKWSKATGHGKMTDPMKHDPSRDRFEHNRDWFSGQNGILAGYFNMKTHATVSLDFAGLKSFLQAHGPIWTAGQKNWDGNDYGHVVVLCGVADTGVFIHDPMPVGRGGSRWLTWKQIQKYVDGATKADYKFLTAA
jgi:hypothetical protein